MVITPPPTVQAHQIACATTPPRFGFVANQPPSRQFAADWRLAQHRPPAARRLPNSAKAEDSIACIAIESDAPQMPPPGMYAYATPS